MMFRKNTHDSLVYMVAEGAPAMHFRLFQINAAAAAAAAAGTSSN
jgi:hypothetical protein